MDTARDIKDIGIYTQILDGGKFTSLFDGGQLNVWRKLYIPNDLVEANERYHMAEKITPAQKIYIMFSSN